MQDAKIIDKNGYIVESVRAEPNVDADGKLTDNIMYYELQDGESVIYNLIGLPMYAPKWDGEKWAETGSPPEPDIEALRAAAIAQTKAWVEKTLAVGMVYADGKTYNVTREKRADLAGVILVGKMKEEQGVLDNMNFLRWNVSGDIHEDWLYKDLCALAYAMYEYVTPIIEKQQDAEIKINAALTVDKINAVVHGLIGGDFA